MDPALVLDALDLHDGLIGRGLEHAVIAARAGVLGIHRPAQRLRPESRGLVYIGCAAIYEQSTETGMVHVDFSCLQPARLERRLIITRSMGARSKRGRCQWFG